MVEGRQRPLIVVVDGDRAAPLARADAALSATAGHPSDAEPSPRRIASPLTQQRGGGGGGGGLAVSAGEDPVCTPLSASWSASADGGGNAGDADDVAFQPHVH